MTRTLVIINPAAGGGRGKKAWPRIEKQLKEAVGSFELAWTSGPGDATRLAKDSNRARIIACGGDGTIHEVANGILARTKSGAVTPMPTLGIISLGTGGDLIKSLGIPSNPLRQIEILRRGHERKIDVGSVEFGTGRRFFVNIADAGIGAEVLKRLSQCRETLGPRLAYLIASLQAFSERKPIEMEVTIDGRKERFSNILLAAVANGRFFGGGMQVASRADVEDGLLDLILVKDLKPLWLLATLPLLYIGRLHLLPQVTLRRGKEIRLVSREPAGLDIDGELIGSLPARFEIMPKTLCVNMP